MTRIESFTENCVEKGMLKYKNTHTTALEISIGCRMKHATFASYKQQLCCKLADCSPNNTTVY